MRKFSSDEGSQQLKSTIHSPGQSRHRPIFREGCPSEIDEEIPRQSQSSVANYQSINSLIRQKRRQCIELETELEIREARCAQKLKNVRQEFVALKFSYQDNSQQLKQVEEMVRQYERMQRDQRKRALDYY